MLALLLVAAQTPEVPAIVRASPHFYGAIGGNQATVTAIATPATVAPGEIIQFSIQLKGFSNLDQVLTPKLDMPGFEILERSTFTRKYITSLSFHYRLRPRDASVKE